MNKAMRSFGFAASLTLISPLAAMAQVGPAPADKPWVGVVVGALLAAGCLLLAMFPSKRTYHD